MVANSMARKMPKRSRMETSSVEPSTTERISVRYSGASPVWPDQRRRREHGEEGRACDYQLEVQREAVDHEAATEVASREAGRQQNGCAPEHGQRPYGGEARRHPWVATCVHADHEDQDQEPCRDQLRQERDEGLPGH